MQMNSQQERETSINDYLRILYNGRWIIVISFFMVVSFVTYYTFTTTPIYEAKARVMFKENNTGGESFLKIAAFREKEKMINNQIQILISRTLSEKVIEKLQMSQYANELCVLGNEKNEKKIKFNIVKSIKGMFSVLKKNEETVIDPEELFAGYVNTLMGSISIEPIRDTDVVTISYNATSPFEAAYIANIIATTYQNENRLENQAEVRKVKEFLEEQLDLVQNKLMKSEVALKTYMEDEKVVSLSEETVELINKIAEFETLYKEALLALMSTQERLDFVDHQLNINRQNFNTETLFANPFIIEITKQIADLETRKAAYIASLINKGVYDENNSTVLEYEKSVKILTDKVKARTVKLAAAEIGDPIALSQSLFEKKIELDATIHALKPKAEALKKIVNEYSSKLELVPEKSLQLARLQRSAKLDEKLTLMMKEKFEESRIREVGQLGNVRIIDPAKSPKSPIKPKKKVNMIFGVIVGLGLGIGITFLLEFFDNSVRSTEDIEKLNIPMLGAIPMIKLEEAVARLNRSNNGNGKSNKTSNINSRLITHFAPKSPISEAYRSLRTSIQFSRADEGLKTIAVTSPGPQEGKSTTISNLAITMSQMGSKILLIDTDLRRPVLHTIFGIGRSKGISNYLIGKIPLEEAIFKTEIENLSVMPSGTLPPNPSELLASAAMKQCVSELKNRFDLILFDSPPVIAVTDAAILSSQVDGVILVVKSGQTNRFALERAYSILHKVAGQKLLGALLNVVNVEGTYGSYYYYYYHYYYGSKHGEKSKNKKYKKSKMSI